MVTGGLGAVVGLLSIVLFAIGGVAALAGKDAASALPGVGIMLVSSVVGLAISGFVGYAGWQMRQMNGWGLSMAGAILAMIPCLSPCCLLGLPIGIWAILVLIDEEVKQAFGSGGDFVPPPGGFGPPPGSYAPPSGGFSPPSGPPPGPPSGPPSGPPPGPPSGPPPGPPPGPPSGGFGPPPGSPPSPSGPSGGFADPPSSTNPGGSGPAPSTFPPPSRLPDASPLPPSPPPPSPLSSLPPTPTEQRGAADRDVRLLPDTMPAPSRRPAPAGECDMCNAPISTGSVIFSAGEIRFAADRGFRPSGTAGGLTAAISTPGSTAEAGWLSTVRTSTTDWALCPPCANAVEPYLQGR
jgi:hypothetical protein